ncbi:hypothetical protein FOZ62_027096 [Perkinsus olseni]|uniref:Uncharacterized protein n=1 Tax=Perkinsus olseni TaxID=32597 RepID=A0A7J6S010_PEROL|nr:hypothetical protein FOZ62_027096 [Perkinsus olseni]
MLTPSAGAKILSAAGELSAADLPTTCPPFEFWLLKKLDQSVCVFDYWVRASKSWDTEGILSDLALARAEAAAMDKVDPSQLNSAGELDASHTQRAVPTRE